MKRTREMKAKQKARRIAKHAADVWAVRGDQPYVPYPTGKTLADVEARMGWAPGFMEAKGITETKDGPRMPREDIEAAIKYSQREMGYTMRGTIDAALAAGARPMIVRGTDDGHLALMGWHVNGNVVLV